jgi:hypothetical protein
MLLLLMVKQISNQFITKAKTDLTKVKDDATEDMTTTANNAKSSVARYSYQHAINSVN